MQREEASPEDTLAVARELSLAGVAIQSQKSLEDEETAPQAAVPGATGFHPRLTQKKLREENKRPKSSLICCQPAAAGRLPKCCSD